MTSQQFLDLSTKLFKDMKGWIEEASKDASLGASDLALLNSAMAIVERVAISESDRKPHTNN
jgi:hypothetical protein